MANFLEGADKKKLALGAIICVVVLYVDVAYLFGWQIRSIAGVNPKIASLKRDIVAFRKDFAAMQAARKVQAERNSEVMQRLGQLLTSDQVPALLESITKTANKYGMTITQVDASRDNSKEQAASKLKGAAGEQFVAYVVTMQLSGGYHQLGEMLAELDRGQAIMLLQQLRITPKENDFMRQNFNLVFKAYVKK